MINFKTFRRRWLNSKFRQEGIDQENYKKHFQLAIINLEQNLIEERIPELRKTA
jgi:hypothetical protein